MKKAKRFLALAGVVLLVSMYVLTLIFSYANMLVFQHLQNKKEREQLRDEEASSAKASSATANDNTKN